MQAKGTTDWERAQGKSLQCWSHSVSRSQLWLYGYVHMYVHAYTYVVHTQVLQVQCVQYVDFYALHYTSNKKIENLTDMVSKMRGSNIYLK